MKKDILILIALVSMLGASVLHSQQASTQIQPAKNPVELLQMLKASNADLIEKQKKTLDALDEMQKTADQLKAMGKRT